MVKFLPFKLSRISSKMSVRLLMSSYSICNTTISCDSLGIHYEVSRKDGVRSVKRWDSSTNTNITVGEIQFRLIITKSLIKLGPTMVQEGEWRNVNDVFVKCRMLSDSRTFEGKDGRRYRWNLTWKGPVVRLLYLRVQKSLRVMR